MGEIVHIENWDDLSLEELDVLERKIAGQFMGLVPWGAVASVSYTHLTLPTKRIV